jgi:hypothetical protein
MDSSGSSEAVRGYRCAVVEISRAVACAECGLYWDGGSEPPRCRNGNHEHRVFEVHRHLDPVVLPGGTRLTAASFDQAAPYVRARVPDYGLYLDPRWQPPWDHGHICWPDFGLPTDADALTRTLRAVLERARSGLPLSAPETVTDPRSSRRPAADHVGRSGDRCSKAEPFPRSLGVACSA